METKITLQELATKLNGKFWSKDGKERIYLDRGNNTKKMSTSTYIQMSENGLFFDVKCFVNCPSQSYNWCKSQADIVIENIEQDIKEALASEYFYVVNSKDEVIDDCCKAKQLSDLYTGGGLYLSNFAAKRFIELEDIEATVKSISRGDFEKLESESVTIEAPTAQEHFAVKATKELVSNIELQKRAENAIIPEINAGQKVTHDRFGLGEVIEVLDNKLKISFEKYGEKSLLTRFANLTYL